MSGSALQQLLDPLDDLLRGLQRGALRQRQVDEQLRPVRLGEELLLHELHADQRQHEQSGRAASTSLLCAAPGRACGGTTARSADGPWPPWPLSLSGRMNTPVSGVNSTATIQDTTSAMPTTANSEKQYSPAPALREADRHEAGDGHQRAGQHRERGGGVGEGGGFDLVVALLHLGDHHLDRDHGVVDQQAERDDERAERDALQRDAGELHHHEGDGEHQRDGDGDHDAGPPAERQEADRQHDGDRLHQALGELADGLLHHMRLVGDEVHVDADGQVARRARRRAA